MQKLARSEIQKLAKQTHDPSVSLFMTTDKSDYSANREKFRHILNQARSELTNLTSYELRHEVLYPAYKLVHDRKWWQTADKSVAVYTAQNFIRAFHLPEEIKTNFLIGRHFNVIPLLDRINTEGTFYILALSQRNTRLLWSDHNTVDELETADMPRSIDERPDKFQQRKPSRHDYYAGDHRNSDIFKFLHEVDNAVTPILRTQQAPLILAGLPHIVALFKKLTHYNHVIAKTINYNVDRLNNSELRDRAWALIEPYYKADERLARTQLEQLVKTQPGRVLRGMKRILVAVQQGRVQTLFIDAGAHIWGKFNVPAHRLTVHRNHMPGDADLLNLAVSETLNRKGNVFTLDTSLFPSGSHSIAILRY